ncbi:MAG: hypothetical protein ACYDH8_06805 [Syntrophales bacterium]
MHNYKIKMGLRFPLGVDALLLLCLVMISIMVVGSAVEKVLFTVFFVGTAYLFWESLRRRVTIDENGLFLRRLLSQKKLPWEAITHVGGLTIKNKSYILLTTVVGFYIISNYYERFTLLAEDLLSHVEADRVEDAARFLIEEKPLGLAGSALVWVAAVLLTGIIVLKMYPFIL